MVSRLRGAEQMDLNKEQNIRISFLIPTLGEREAELERLFESLAGQVVSEDGNEEARQTLPREAGQDNRRSATEYMELIVVAQDNFEVVRAIVKKYEDALNIVLLESDEKGLSKARNRGLAVCRGEIVILSDDDCWYAEGATDFWIEEFKNPQTDIVFTQIKDYEQDRLYKSYPAEEEIIKSKWKLLSRSSIEIAYRKSKVDVQFDELFGVGARFKAGEENDFLLNAYKRGATMKYIPKVTVYHPKKTGGDRAGSNEARGAFYAKHFNRLIGFMICCRDLVFRKENVFKDFFRGYNGYCKIKRSR